MPRGKKNAIVVMFDSMQHNYLGCYGNEWMKTPNLDRFAREGVLFENAYVEGLPTVPARRAMHTGRYTLPVSGWVALTLEDTTIADLCWGLGIDTALVFDCPNYRLPKFGYTRGFDNVMFTHGSEGDDGYYYDDPLYHRDPKDYIEDHFIETADEITGSKVVGPLMEEISTFLKAHQYWKSPDDRFVARTIHKAIRYLEEVDRTHPFFLWVDSFDPHEPWDPPSVYMDFPCPYDPDYKGKDQFLPMLGPVEGLYTEEELHHVRMLYAELITLCDTYFGELMDAVRRLGLEDDTLVMVVSDHGEPLGNGEHGHGIMRKVRPWPYEELVHGIMMMRGPGLPAGKRMKSFVQSVDVAPTMCDWLCIGVQSFHQGVSLLPLARGEVDKVRDFAIAGYHKFSWSIITEDWSYIHWLKHGESDGAYMSGIYIEGTKATGADIPGIKKNALYGDNSAMQQKKTESSTPINDAMRRHQEAASLDGEAQWTCTPGSIAEVPDVDELYNRHTDKFQLHNVASEYPDIAKKLLIQLTEYINELKIS